MMFYKKRYEEAIEQNKRNAKTIEFLQLHVNSDVLRTSNDIATGRKDFGHALWARHAEMSLKQSAWLVRWLSEYQKQVKTYSDSAVLAESAMSAVNFSAIKDKNTITVYRNNNDGELCIHLGDEFKTREGWWTAIGTFQIAVKQRAE